VTVAKTAYGASLAERDRRSAATAVAANEGSRAWSGTAKSTAVILQHSVNGK
jgi:hypothetical protein